MLIISILLILAAVYLAAGLLFAMLFVTKGVDVIDEGSHGTGWGFRLIIVPGTILLWPVLLIKWKRALKK
ncbi:MAG TPA: hypothetical protein VGD17_07795 [Chitinophagaceae bacterium]